MNLLRIENIQTISDFDKLLNATQAPPQIKITSFGKRRFIVNGRSYSMNALVLALYLRCKDDRTMTSDSLEKISLKLNDLNVTANKELSSRGLIKRILHVFQSALGNCIFVFSHRHRRGYYLNQIAIAKSRLQASVPVVNQRALSESSSEEHTTETPLASNPNTPAARLRPASPPQFTQILSTADPLIVKGCPDPFPILTISAKQQRHESGANLFQSLFRRGGQEIKLELDDITLVMGYVVDLTKTQAIVLTDAQKEMIRSCFNVLRRSDLKSLERDIRHLMKEKWALQCILSKDIERLHDKSPLTPHEKFELKLARVRLSTSFGICKKNASSGANGAVLMYPLENEPPLIVFKAPLSAHERGLVRAVTSGIKDRVGQASILGDDLEYREVVASDFCRHMGFEDIAPLAEMQEIGDKRGACIDFLEGYGPLHEVLEQFEAKKRYHLQEILSWQMLCIWAFAVEDLDPHDKNIYVTQRQIESESCYHFKMIDHGNCFPLKHPDSDACKGSVGDWGKYAISKTQFDPAILSFIDRELTREKVLAFFFSQDPRHLERRAHFKINDGDTGSDCSVYPQVQLSMQRIHILRALVSKKKIPSPSVLGKIRLDTDYRRCLEE